VPEEDPHHLLDYDDEEDPEMDIEEEEPEEDPADDELKVKEAGVEPEAEGADVELEAEEPDEREILHHDLSGVEETLGNVVKRLKVLESEENATLRKKLAEKEVLLDLTRM
nr:hypothetical protein [Tanacetum cinerariifolium]